MKIGKWLRAQTERRRKRKRQAADERRDQFTPLFLTRLEDRRVLAAPVGFADAYFVDEAGSLFVGEPGGVLSNDFDPDGDDITASLVGSPPIGQIFLNSDGSFLYNADSASGSYVDTFFYEVSDEGATTGPVQVTVYVGKIVAQEDQTRPLDVFFVDPGMTGGQGRGPGPSVDVTLTSNQPAGTQPASLTLLNTMNITFISGNNGDDQFTFQGDLRQVNLALDSLRYKGGNDVSGIDNVTMSYITEFSDTGLQTAVVDINPVADAPFVFIEDPIFAPDFNVPFDINITVQLTDTDGSEFISDIFIDLPEELTLSAGTRIDPFAYHLTLAELSGLTGTLSNGGPPLFPIFVTAFSDEFDNGDFAFEFSVSTVIVEGADFFGPGFPGDGFFFLFGARGPLQFGPGKGPGPPPGPPPIPFFNPVESQEDAGNEPPIQTFAREAQESFQFSAATWEDNDGIEQMWSDEGGLFVAAYTADGEWTESVALPTNLTDDYEKLLKFLRGLPNGDYTLYLRLGNQTHEQAIARQTLFQVRVVNHQLNPDAEEFKPPTETITLPPGEASTELTPSDTTKPVTTNQDGENVSLAEPPPMEAPVILQPETTTDEGTATLMVSAAMTGMVTAAVNHRRVDQSFEQYTKRHCARFKLHPRGEP